MLSLPALEKIDREIEKYPPQHKRSAVMAALRIAQEEKGWIAIETMDFVAGYLGVPPIAVYEVASFYTMYDTRPVGRHRITLCTNLPCALSGAEDISRHLRGRLNIDFGETSADGGFTLKEGQCFGSCGDAPVVLIDNRRLCGFLTPEKVDQILAELG
ncbi:MAG: NADH-quinone oxidoreductase subunit NuoE [Burkholderiales bacterium]